MKAAASEDYIPHLSDNLAFLKGVEYFSEVVFFYGILAGMVLYEVRKTYKA